MHIPDGFLDTKTWTALGVVSLLAAGTAVAKTGNAAGEERVPLMGVMASFVFAAQMLNFPVGGGTSGHFMGAALCAILLGPFSAVLVMTTLIIVQCLLFQDGGVTALGANVFNMGVIGSFTGYGVYRSLEFLTPKGFKGAKARLVSAAAAGWCSVVLSSSACAGELALSGTVPLAAALPAMAGVHAVTGIGEAAVTAVILGFITKVRPDLLEIEKI
ncbi:MAG: energy-coupling factor ABC transporter permease [Endomicrobiales bacterium]